MIIKLKDIGIEDCIRKPEDPDKICLLKIKGEWNEYKMVKDEYDWLEVVLPLKGGTYRISLLDINILLGGVGKINA